MKASMFNTFFNDENVQVGFNSYSNEFFILDPFLYDIYTTALLTENFHELEEIHKDFYDYLLRTGFIVNYDFDEFEMIKQKSVEIDNDSSQFELIINPTMNCNFKCWYCYETHIKDSKMDEVTIESIVTLINNIVESQKGLKRLAVSFFGGEPLLYFDKVIKPILEQASEICKYKKIIFDSGMTTNGLLINQKMLEICKKNGLNGFQITLDGNRERHDKVRFISEGRGSYDKIIENIILAACNDLLINVRINCSNETMENINEILTDFDKLPLDKRKYIRFNIHKVWQESDNIKGLLSETRTHFREQGYVVTSEFPSEILSSCYADKRYQATVNYNGEVFKCTARDFKNHSGEGTLNIDGTIAWNDRHEKRLKSKFKNAPCKECRILPLCSGGCSQAALENEGHDYCVMGFDEDAKTQMIKNRFHELVS